MKVTTLRIPEPMYEAIEADAKAEGKNVSEYIRDVLSNRANTQTNTDEYGERIRDLEQRVNELEEHIQPSAASADSLDQPTDPSEAAEAAVRWLHDLDEPAGRSEIVDEWFSESFHIKPDSWWRRHVRPALEEAGFEFTRNVGWHLPRID